MIQGYVDAPVSEISTFHAVAHLHYELDAMGNRFAETTHDVEGVTYDRGDVGSYPAARRARGRIYNTLNRLVATLEGGVDESAYLSRTRYLHDDNGNVKTIVDPRDPASDPATASNKTEVTYDALNRAVKQESILAVSQVPPHAPTDVLETSQGFDALDAVTVVEDGLGVQTDYFVNGFGEVEQIDSPDTGLTEYTYDASGNVVTRTNALNEVTHYEYDSLNRLVKQGYSTAGGSAPPAWITYSYDDPGTPSAYRMGRLWMIEEPDGGEIEYTYDARGNTVEKNVAQPAENLLSVPLKAYFTRYEYNEEDRLSKIVYPAHDHLTDIPDEVVYLKDEVGRNQRVELTQDKGELTEQTWVLVKDVTYEPFGGIASMTHGDLGSGDGETVGTVYGYDLAYRMADITVTSSDLATGVVMDWHLDYDAAGNVDFIDDQVPGSVKDELDFAYDNLSRVTDVIDSVGIGTRYEYDHNHNRILEARGDFGTPGVDPDDTRYEYELGTNRLKEKWLDTTAGPSYLREVYEHYDTGGLSRYGYSPTSLNRHTVQRDREGRLLSYEWRTGESDVENRHNPLWQRTHHASFHDYYGHQSYRNAFLYNESGQIIVESRTAGLHAEWIYMDGLPVATVRWDGHPNGGGDPEVLFIHTDHLGTARYVTDTAGELRAWTLYSTDPFKIRWGGLNFELGFPGQYNMVEVPYWYNWHRDYMPESGRYLQPDPIGLAGGLNTYAYANTNPLRYTDPYGLFAPAAAAEGAALFSPLGPVGAIAGAVIVGGLGSYALSEFWDWYDAKHPIPDAVPDDENDSDGDPYCPPGESAECAEERKVCHPICTAQCVGKGLNSDAPACYTRCLRGCLSPRCADNH